MSAIRVIALFSLLVATSFALFMPACKPFFLEIKSIKQLRINKDFFGAETKLYIDKFDKYRYGVKGCLEFLKETGPLSASMAVQVKDQSSSSTSGRYNDYKNDFMKLGLVCSSIIIKPFFDLYINKTTHGSCVFNPQLTCLPKDKGINIDEEIHKGMQSVECGSFKIFLRYSVPDISDPVVEWEIIAEVVPRNDMKNGTETRQSGQRNQSNKGKSKGKKN